jgi:TRAP-type C4-dicarboxylate transport system substrate-binding protein
MGRYKMLATGLLMLGLVAGSVGCGGDEASPTPTDGATATPEPITLTMVSTTKTDGAAAPAYQLFADLVEEYSDGSVTVDIYPNSQLYPATEQWEAVATGAVDMLADASYWIYQYVPDVMVFYMDGIWDGREHCYAALEDSDLPQVMAERIEDAGPMKALGFIPASLNMGIINSVRETKYLEDLEGLRIQSSPGSPPPAMYDYVGAKGVPLSLEETSLGFMQGILDAVHMTADTIDGFRLYDTGQHVLWRISMFPNLVMIMNRDSWDSLPADLQDAIENEIMPQVYEFDKRNYREVEDAAMETIAQNVKTVNWVTEQDLDAYVEYAQTHPVYMMQMLMVDPRIIEIVEQIRPE